MEFLEITLGQLLHRSALTHPDAPALRSDECVWSYVRLDEESDVLAKGFLRAGLHKGNHVAIYSGNSFQMVCAIFALAKIGAIAVLVGGSDSGTEVSRITRQSDCDYLLFGGNIRGISTCKIVESADFSFLQGCFCLEDGASVNCPNLSALLSLANEVSEVQLDLAKADVYPRDNDIMLFTSGSTGSPKGVLLTHFARVNNALAQSRAMGVGSGDRVCCALPLFHCFALSAVLLPALASGACVCFPRDHHMASVLRTIEICSCTAFLGVPTIFSALLARSDLEQYDLSSLRFGMIAGSSYSPGLFQEVARRLDIRLLPGLGMTETTAGITCGSFEDDLEILSHSVGKLFPGVNGKICDEEGKDLHLGQEGEICLRGWCVMEGYYHQPEQTKKVFDADGWFHTGDLGFFDTQGNLYITGRRKELIIRGGENISPLEVENVIAADPRIVSVKVVGVPDPHYIEEICACVIPRDPLDAETVCALVSKELARFKVPRYVLFFTDIPKTANGKWDVPRLRIMAMNRLGLSELCTDESMAIAQ